MNYVRLCIFVLDTPQWILILVGSVIGAVVITALVCGVRLCYRVSQLHRRNKERNDDEKHKNVNIHINELDMINGIVNRALSPPSTELIYDIPYSDSYVYPRSNSQSSDHASCPLETSVSPISVCSVDSGIPSEYSPHHSYLEVNEPSETGESLELDEENKYEQLRDEKHQYERLREK